MITPSPTTKIDPTVARGVFEGAIAEVIGLAPRPAMVAISFPNTSYQMHLVPVGGVESITTEVGKRFLGVIRAQARRIDVVNTGGRYVEPVYGRPRRVQGRVVAVVGKAVVVDAGMPIHCTPMDPRQTASQFQVGQFVSFDVLEGATVEQR